MAAVAELDASLGALLNLKPPGVTKGRISSITQLCVENVKSESVIIQKIFTHFKRTPATHKLGVLYAIDSIARQWIEKAGASGQDLRNSNAQDGTYAAGVNRISELLPAMMNELIAQAPDDQIEKINKLVDIWERGNTFPAHMITDFKAKIVVRPVKMPSPELEKPAEDPPPIIQEAPAPVSQTPQQPPSGLAIGNLNQSLPPASLATSTGQPQSSTSSQEGWDKLMQFLPAHALSDPQKITHYLKILQQLVSLNVPTAQWGDVIKALDEQQQQSAGNPLPSQVPLPIQQQNSSQSQNLQTQVGRSSPYRARSRSPQRRGSPTYGGYGQSSYRERSPRGKLSPSVSSGDFRPNNRPKWLEIDPNLPSNHIKVLSRTLFVGGTTCPERELRDVFSRFGGVQSVITNPQKRHAFVKMYTRAESVRAKTEMDHTEDQNILSRARSTKWGVGFGPRECCDYNEGVSVIPIDRLTDADRRWILSADYGGNGGRDITHGQVMEEPDIEIGAGVSSKAISLRVGAGGGTSSSGGNNRPQRRGGGRNRDHGRDHGNGFRGPPPTGYNPTGFPPQPMGPPQHEAMPPMGGPPPMPGFGYAPPPQQGGFNMFPPGMPPFPMQ